MKRIPALFLLAAASLDGCATIPAPEAERSDKAAR